MDDPQAPLVESQEEQSRETNPLSVIYDGLVGHMLARRTLNLLVLKGVLTEEEQGVLWREAHDAASEYIDSLPESEELSTQELIDRRRQKDSQEQ